MDNIIRVIVAEDLEILREHFCEIINSQNDMKVVASASSGRQAVQLADDVGADIFLMDIEMDVRHDGIIAAKNIISKYPSIKVVFLTVHEDDETVFNSFETGCVDYVLKAASSEEIVRSIRLAYAGNSSIRPEIAYKIRNEFSRMRKNENQIFGIMSIISELTNSEKEILALLLQDKRISEIADARKVEVSTIKSQINIILKKFNKKRTKEVIRLIKDMNISQVFNQIRCPN